MKWSRTGLTHHLTVNGDWQAFDCLHSPSRRPRRERRRHVACCSFAWPSKPVSLCKLHLLPLRSMEPTPLRSLVGGFLLVPPIHALFLSDATRRPVLGISGFVHRSFNPSSMAVTERFSALAGLAGLVAGGASIEWLLNGASDVFTPSAPTANEIAWKVGIGLLMGLGTRCVLERGGSILRGPFAESTMLNQACQRLHIRTHARESSSSISLLSGSRLTFSPHQAGLTRLSPRSLVATSLFFLFGVPAATYHRSSARFFSAASDVASPIWDWTIGSGGWTLIAAWVAVGLVQFAWLKNVCLSFPSSCLDFPLTFISSSPCQLIRLPPVLLTASHWPPSSPHSNLPSPCTSPPLPLLKKSPPS